VATNHPEHADGHSDWQHYLAKACAVLVAERISAPEFGEAHIPLERPWTPENVTYWPGIKHHELNTQ
jgi:hypothetical protein